MSNNIFRTLNDVDIAKTLNQQGEDLFSKGDIKGALNAFIKAIEIDPNFATAYNNLGVLYWQVGDAQRAIEHFTKALKVNPNDRNTILNFAHVLMSIKRLVDTANLYKSYLQKNPNDTEIARLLRRLEGIAESDSLPKYNAEGIEKDKHFFFIVGTPRSGTKWFSNFFSTDEVFCFHELSLLCHGNLQSHREALLKFKPIPGNTLESHLHRLFYLYPSFGRLMYHKLYKSSQYVACGNSDCGQTHFLRALHHIFLKARFLLVLRNGFDVALSLEKKMMEPNSEKIIEYHKRWIMEKYGYQSKNLFEIACWRWRRGTEWLLESAKNLSPDRTMLVSFEKTLSDIETLKNIWDFLLAGKVAFNQKRAGMLLNKPVNVGTHQKPIGKTIGERWSNLDVARRDSFMKIAGSFMKNLPIYKGWPDLDF